MRKEWLLTLASTAITLLFALVLIRWFAPGLLGYATDQRLVRVSEEVPPFYENIFREADYAQAGFLINDPNVLVRPKPLFPDVTSMGPNDILGFRNRNVPNKAEIVTIGDSQTYGNNAMLEDNWPSQLETALFPASQERIYSMAVGGWGGVNYLRILDAALRFKPRVVIVAYYSGNDAGTDFVNAYGIDELAYLRPDPDLKVDDAPTNVELAADDRYPVTFKDGVETVFTPDYRLISNDRSDSTVVAGWQVMAATARRIARRVQDSNAIPVFTVIPTKEYVYADKIAAEGLTENARYQRLIADETRNIGELAGALQEIIGATYIDVTTAMREAAMGPEQLYPPDVNGHPLAAGYRVIANTIADGLVPEQVPHRKGFYALVYNGQVLRFALLTRDGMWTISDRNIAAANDWDLDNIPVLDTAEVSALPFLGELREIDPARFGPAAVLPARD